MLWHLCQCQQILCKIGWSVARAVRHITLCANNYQAIYFFISVSVKAAFCLLHEQETFLISDRETHLLPWKVTLNWRRARVAVQNRPEVYHLPSFYFTIVSWWGEPHQHNWLWSVHICAIINLHRFFFIILFTNLRIKKNLNVRYFGTSIQETWSS